MDKYDPSKWTREFVKRNRRECEEIQQMMTAAICNALAHNDYLAAALACDKACTGFAIMGSVWGVEQYGGPLYTYSFLLAEISMFGGLGDDWVKSGMAPLQDAYDFACKYISAGGRTSQKARKDAETFTNMINDIKRGVSVKELKEKYSPNFPEEWLA